MNRKLRGVSVVATAALALTVLSSSAAASVKDYDKNPPFSMTLLKPTEMEVGGKKVKAYNPKNEYNAFVNYELGMHCVGFEMSYCCVIPPYNSIQSQAVKSGQNGEMPKLMTLDDKIKLYYYTKDNSYSEGNKMKYWSVAKDVDGNG
ncbi:MAG: hypothetical protein P8Y65_11315, partial [Campylobacterales bacterium]